MDKDILEFLSIHRVCSLTTLLSDGSPHSAAMHYSHTDSPLQLIFSTESSSRKCESLKPDLPLRSSVVVGFSEDEWKTLQMEGEIKIATEPSQLAQFKSIYYPKNPASRQYEHDPDTVFLIFTPHWWRFTDYTTKPKTIISSEK